MAPLDHSGLHDGGDLDAELRAASMKVRAGSLPPGFDQRDGAIWFQPPAAKATGAPPPAFEVCQTFEVVARTTDEHSASPGSCIRWSDSRGVTHDWIVLDTILHDEARVLARELTARNFRVEPGNHVYTALKGLFGNLRGTTTEHRTTVERAGWHCNGRSFLLQDGSVYGDPGALFVARTAGRNRTRGTLAEWQSMVAEVVPGNSRLLLSVALPFAGPLLEISGEDFAGIHIFGDSSVGKSTAAALAGSVWGEPSKHDQVRSWRATDNGLEGTAAEHTDTVLILDEIAQVEPRIIGECAYMLANGAGKARAAKDGSAREVRRWRLAILSTGEHTIEDAMKAAGKRAPGGIDVRLINVQAKAGAGMGLFEDCHGMQPADFAASIVRSCMTSYGTAGREFIDLLTTLRTDDNDDLVRKLVAGEIAEFLEAALTSKADGQVQRVARKFGVIAAAGELAILLEVLPLVRGSVRAACVRCFQDWLKLRGIQLGTAGASRAKEHVDLLARIRAHVEQYGSTRFEDLDLNPGERPRVIGPRSGYRKGGAYLFVPSVLSELMAPTKPADGLAVLHEANLLDCNPPAGDPKHDFRRNVRIEGSPTTVVIIRESILDDLAD